MVSLDKIGKISRTLVLLTHRSIQEDEVMTWLKFTTPFPPRVSAHAIWIKDGVIDVDGRKIPKHSVDESGKNFFSVSVALARIEIPRVWLRPIKLYDEGQYTGADLGIT